MNLSFSTVMNAYGKGCSTFIVKKKDTCMKKKLYFPSTGLPLKICSSHMALRSWFYQFVQSMASSSISFLLGHFKKYFNIKSLRRKLVKRVLFLALLLVLIQLSRLSWIYFSLQCICSTFYTNDFIGFWSFELNANFRLQIACLVHSVTQCILITRLWKEPWCTPVP